MGELLRRHWHPIAAVTEFEDKSTKQVRLLSEDLVLYKDRSGTFGLLALHCAHRRADLSYGFVEECGLRCSYHGWAFDQAGNCLSAPFEDSSSGNTRFRDQIKQPAYPVQEMGGLIFAYLGPQPAAGAPPDVARSRLAAPLRERAATVHPQPRKVARVRHYSAHTTRRVR